MDGTIGESIWLSGKKAGSISSKLLHPDVDLKKAKWGEAVSK